MTPTIALICLTAFTSGILLAFAHDRLSVRIKRIRRQLKALAAVLYAVQQWMDAEQARRDFRAVMNVDSYHAADLDLEASMAQQGVLEAARAARAEGLDLSLFSRLS